MDCEKTTHFLITLHNCLLVISFRAQTELSVDELPSALPKPTFCDTCAKKRKPHKTANVYCVVCDMKYCAAHSEVSKSAIYETFVERNFVQFSWNQSTLLRTLNHVKSTSLRILNTIRFICRFIMIWIQITKDSESKNIWSLHSLKRYDTVRSIKNSRCVWAARIVWI